MITVAEKMSGDFVRVNYKVPIGFAGGTIVCLYGALRRWRIAYI